MPRAYARDRSSGVFRCFAVAALVVCVLISMRFSPPAEAEDITLATGVRRRGAQDAPRSAALRPLRAPPPEPPAPRTWPAAPAGQPHAAARRQAARPRHGAQALLRPRVVRRPHGRRPRRAGRLRPPLQRRGEHLLRGVAAPVAVAGRRGLDGQPRRTGTRSSTRPGARPASERCMRAPFGGRGGVTAVGGLWGARLPPLTAARSRDDTRLAVTTSRWAALKSGVHVVSTSRSCLTGRRARGVATATRRSIPRPRT